MRRRHDSPAAVQCLPLRRSRTPPVADSHTVSRPRIESRALRLLQPTPARRARSTLPRRVHHPPRRPARSTQVLRHRNHLPALHRRCPMIPASNGHDCRDTPRTHIPASCPLQKSQIFSRPRRSNPIAQHRADTRRAGLSCTSTYPVLSAKCNTAFERKAFRTICLHLARPLLHAPAQVLASARPGGAFRMERNGLLSSARRGSTDSKWSRGVDLDLGTARPLVIFLWERCCRCSDGRSISLVSQDASCPLLSG